MIASLALLSLIISAIAFAAAVSTRRTQLEMAQTLAELSMVERRPIDALKGPGPAAMLVVQAGCATCAECAPSMSVGDGGIRTYIASADRAAVAYSEGRAVEAITDSRLVGELFVAAYPTIVEFDEAGTETRRRIVSSPRQVEDFLASVGTDRNLRPSGRTGQRKVTS